MKDNVTHEMQDFLRAVTRRHFFRQAGFGIGAAALTTLINRYTLGSDLPPSPPTMAMLNPMAPKPGHFAPKAKSIIYLFMAGAPSQVDLLDYKPKLQELDGRHSLGSWLTYGIGSEAANLPGFVVLLSGENQPDGGTACWGSGFLPTVYQGVQFRSQGDPVLFLTNPEGVSPEVRRRSLDLLKNLNEMHLHGVGDPEISTRIASYEMAYRMQTSVPDL